MPIRPSCTATVVLIAVLAARTALASAAFSDSPHLESIPAFGRCDVIVDPSVAPATLQALFNDPAKRVFCIEPGDYRSAGRIDLQVSGTEASRRFLRFHAQDGLRNAVQRPARALFETLHIFGDWWVVQGLTFQPLDPTSGWFVAIRGADHVVLDGNLLDGSDQANAWNNTGVNVTGFNGDPATYNSVQANVVRNGDQSGNADDYDGIMIREGFNPGEDNDYNKVLDNEIYDWGDGISVSGHRDDCQESGIQHGTIVDGNDIYLTEAKRVDCASGARDPNGECACAENAIDVKSRPGPEAWLWTQITNNRAWGFRPTSPAAHCGGSGANGQAITAGNSCPGNVLVARNVILDSTNGVTAAGPSWIIVGNLFHDIRVSEGLSPYGAMAILPSAYATDVRVEFNTVVDVDNSYDDRSSTTDTRCNAVVDDQDVMGTGGFRGPNHWTERNFLYEAPAGNFPGATNESYATAAESGNTEYCFWRKRWTAPERVCIPLANTTASSPHAQDVGDCHHDLLAPFGIEAISYPSSAVPEPMAAWLGLSSALSLGALARRRERAKRRDR